MRIAASFNSSVKALVKTVATAGVLGGVSLSAALPAQAAEYTMAIAHVFGEKVGSNEIATSLAHFEQLVETATNGDIEVQVFGGGALGSEVEAGKQAQRGRTVQSVLMSSGPTSSFFKDYQLVTTPFLFIDYATAWEFFDSPWFAEFMQGMKESSQLRYLGTFDETGGFVAFTNNKRQIKTVEDIKGLKIRVEENPAHINLINSLGGSATPLPWAEVSTAITTGLADGQFNPPGLNDQFKLADITDYTTLTGHVYNSTTWAVSERWFQDLPKAYQQIIVEAAREAVAIGHGVATQASIVGWENSCKSFKGCYVLPKEEKAKMRDLTLPAYKDWVVKDYGIGETKVNAFWAEVDAASERAARKAAAYLN